MADEVKVTGLVERPMELAYADLSAMPGQIADVSALAPRREGVAVRFSAILDAAGLRDGAQFVTLEARGRLRRPASRSRRSPIRPSSSTASVALRCRRTREARCAS